MVGNATEAAAKALRATHSAMKDLGRTRASDFNGETARNILHQEMNYFGQYNHDYRYNLRTARTLLAHGRQDAAHALVNTITLLDEMRKTRRLLRVVMAVCTLNMIGLAALIF